MSLNKGSIIKGRPGWLVVLCATLLLSGCSALRVGYDNGPRLAWWWIDGQFGFDREQSAAVRGAIDRWFDWHRSTQLDGAAALLAELRRDVAAPTTPAAVCGWSARLRAVAAPAIDRAVVEAADLVPLLGDAQLRRLERTFADRDAELRDEMLGAGGGADAAERRRLAVERSVERAAKLYGPLDAAQKRGVAEAIAAAPPDTAGWLDERRQRQRAVVETLRRLVAQRAGRDERLAALRALAADVDRPADPARRAAHDARTAAGCALAARLHDGTTPAQRRRAAERIGEWEADLRALARPPG